MSGYLPYREGIKSVEFDAVFVADRPVNAGKSRIIWAVHRYLQPAFQFAYAAGMIRVMVGNENGLYAHAVIYCGQNRSGVARIDYNGSAIATRITPDVIVGESPQGAECRHQE